MQEEKRQDWEREYIALIEEQKKPSDFTPAELFDMASLFGLRNKFDAVETVYEKFILNHPNANKDDRARVEIHRIDMIRRGNRAKGIKANPDKALQMLKTQEIPEDSLAHAELLQAVSECYLVLDDLQNALSTKEELMAICDNPAHNIPADKILFYRVGLIVVQIKQGDSDGASANLERQRELLDFLPAGQIRDDSFGNYYDLCGQVFEIQGNLPEALVNYNAKFDSSESPGIKAVAALVYLYAVWRSNPKNRNSSTLCMAQYFAENQHEIQPAWIHVLQTKYDFVKPIVDRIT